MPTLNFEPHDRTHTVYSLFVQDEAELVPARLSLIGGLKLERNNYSGVEAQPSIRVLWTPQERQTFWAAATRAVRTPSRLDRDFDLKGYLGGTPATPIYLKIAGNPKFRSERLMGYEAGYRSLIVPKLYLDVSAFHNDYRHLVSLSGPSWTVETSPITHLLFTFPYANGVRGRTNGFEIAPEWNVTSWWQLKGSYSYLRQDLGLEPGATDTSAVTEYEGSNPSHRTIVQSHVNLPGNLELDQTYRYVSSLPFQRVASYGTADLRFGWVFGDTLRFSISGQNLLQPHHAEFGRGSDVAVEIRRSVYASLTWQN